MYKRQVQNMGYSLFVSLVPCWHENRPSARNSNKNVGKKFFFILSLSLIHIFREGVFQLGEEQDGHYDHDVEPRRLRGHNGSNAVGDEMCIRDSLPYCALRVWGCQSFLP